MTKLERGIVRVCTWLAAWLVLLMIGGTALGCCRELHVHIAERVYVTKATDVQADWQTPNEILDEVIDDLTGVETDRETAGEP